MKNIFKSNRVTITIAIILSIVSSLFFLLEIYANQKLISMVERTKKINPSTMIAVFLIYIVSYIIYYFKLQSRAKSEASIRSSMNSDIILSSLKSVPIDWDRKHIGEEVRKFITFKTDLVNDKYFGQIYDLVYNILFIIIGSIILFFYDFKLLIVSIIIYLISWVNSMIFAKMNSKSYSISSEKLEETASKMSNLIDNSVAIIIGDKGCSGFFHNDLIEYNHYYTRGIIVGQISRIISEILSFSRELLILFFVISYKKFNLADIFMILTISTNLSFPFKLLSNQFFEILSTKKIRNDYKQMVNDKTLKDGNKINEQQNINSIEMKNINLSFKNNIVLSKFSALFEYPKKYLIMGESGSGKSQLIKAILGTTVVDSGEILINGEDIISKPGYLESICYIEQQPVLFATIVLENVVLNDIENYDKIKLNKIFKLLNLNVSLEKIINPDNLNISGGELQKLLLARALYFERKCIILDESFTALDKSSASEIEKIFLSIKDTMILHVSHHTTVNIAGKYDKVISLVK